MYTSNNLDKLETEINNNIISISDISDISLNISTLSYKSTFDSSLGLPFSLDFSYKDISCTSVPNVTYLDQLTLGWTLGFRGDYIKKINATTDNGKIKKQSNTCLNNKCQNIVYKNISDISFYYDISGTKLESEGLVDLGDDGHLLLSVDDYQRNHNNVFISPFKNQSSLTNNILGKLTNDKFYHLNYPERIYFGPVNLDKLHITIYDLFGRIYNNNYCDYSIELLVESLYDN